VGKCQRAVEKAADPQNHPVDVLTWLDIG
jgi:hypothetical protein